MTNVKIRVKAAPKILHSAKEAIEALQRSNQYSGAASYAYVQAHRYSPGTSSFHKHLEREALYEDAAEKWNDVLMAWLKYEAGENGC